MTAVPHALHELPREFAVFPLPGALLLPRGRLPLNIFEPRYLAMTDDALAHGRMFAMIQPDPEKPRTETGSALYSVGCLGRLISFSETDDGRYLITLAGIIRFHVAEELAMRRGFRRVRADFSAFLGDLELDEAPVPAFDRLALLTALRGYFSHRGFEANWEAINQMPDDMLVTTLCMVCPFEPVERQALLEASTPTDRAYSLLTLLQIDTHEQPTDDPDVATRRPRAS
jgi:Lon protease-like protein